MSVRDLDKSIAKAKEQRDRAVIRQAKGFLKVMKDCTGDEYVDAELLAEFLKMSVADMILPIFEEYNNFVEQANARLDQNDPDISKKKMIVAGPRFTRGFTSFLGNVYDPGVGKNGIPTVGDVLASYWPDVRDRLETEAAERRELANAKRKAARMAKQSRE